MKIKPQIELDPEDGNGLWLYTEHASRIPFGQPELETLRQEFRRELALFATRVFQSGVDYGRAHPA